MSSKSEQPVQRLLCVVPLVPAITEHEFVRICRGCLATDCSLFNIRDRNLQQIFVDLTGLETVNNCMLCNVCLHLLRKSNEFRTRCLKADQILKCVPLLTENVLSTIDRTHLKPNLLKSQILHLHCGSPLLENEVVTNKSDYADDDLSVTSKRSPFIGLLNDQAKYNPTENCVDILISSDDDGNINTTELGYHDHTYAKEDNLNHILNVNNNLIEDTNCYETSPSRFLDDNYDISDSKIVNPKSEANKNEIDKIIHSIGLLLNSIIMTVMHNENAFYELFETLYQESLKNGRTETLQVKDLGSVTHLLELYKQLADYYQIDIEFKSVEEQRRIMEEKRQHATDTQCKLCCKDYHAVDAYDRHIESRHDEDLPYKCVVCFSTFRQQLQYAQHLLAAHVVREVCKQCGLNFSTGGGLKGRCAAFRKHMMTAHGPARCQYCGRVFRCRNLCLKHLRSVHRSQINCVQCLLCGNTYNGRGLTLHINKIHSVAVKCLTCSVYFADTSTMEAHQVDGLCLNLSGCPLCGATFPTEPLMREHYDHAHAVYKCTKCPLTFVTSFSYEEHCRTSCRDETRPVKMRNRSKPYICEVCGKRYSILALLVYHQRVHTGEMPYQCDHCHKTFRRKNRIYEHMKIHTGERRYKCALCQKRFRQSSHLQAHTLSHTKEKNFACVTCGKRYASAQSMREHKRTVHEGLPPFPRHKRKTARELDD